MFEHQAVEKKQLINEALFKSLLSNDPSITHLNLQIPSIEKWQKLNHSLLNNHYVGAISINLVGDHAFYTKEYVKIREDFSLIARRMSSLEIICNLDQNFATQMDFLKNLVQGNHSLKEFTLIVTDFFIKTHQDKFSQYKKFFKEFYESLPVGQLAEQVSSEPELNQTKKMEKTPKKGSGKRKQSINSQKNVSFKKTVTATQRENNNIEVMDELNNNNNQSGSHTLGPVRNQSQLESLRIKGVELTVEHINVLAPLIQFVHKLEINECMMTEDALIALAVSIGDVQSADQLSEPTSAQNKVNLCQLSLLNITISNKAAKYLGLAFARCADLKVIDLSANRGHNVVVGPIFETLGHNHYLQKLILRNQPLVIEPDLISKVEQAFLDNTTLKVLNVSKESLRFNQNEFLGDFMFLKLLAKNTSIEQVNLNGHYFGIDSALSNLVAALLGAWTSVLNKNLRKISLLNCCLKPDSIPMLSQFLRHASHLEVFKFSGSANGLPLLNSLLDNPHTLLREVELNFAHSEISTHDISILNAFLEQNKTLLDVRSSNPNTNPSMTQFFSAKIWEKNQKYYKNFHALLEMFQSMLRNSSDDFVKTMMKKMDQQIKTKFVENFEPFQRLIAKYTLFKVQFYNKSNDLISMLRVFYAYEWRDVDKTMEYEKAVSLIVAQPGMVKAEKAEEVGLSDWSAQLLYRYHLASEAKTQCQNEMIEIANCLVSNNLVTSCEEIPLIIKARLPNIIETIKKFIYAISVEVTVTPEVEPFASLKNNVATFFNTRFLGMVDQLTNTVDEKMQNYGERLDVASIHLTMITQFWQPPQPSIESLLSIDPDAETTNLHSFSIPTPEN